MITCFTVLAVITLRNQLARIKNGEETNPQFHFQHGGQNKFFSGFWLTKEFH